MGVEFVRSVAALLAAEAAQRWRPAHHWGRWFVMRPLGRSGEFHRDASGQIAYVRTAAAAQEIADRLNT